MDLRSMLLACVLGLAAALPIPGLAQAPAEPAAPAPDATTAAPVAISVADIADRANEDQRLANDVTARAAAHGGLDALEAELEAIRDSVDAKARTYTRAQLARLPVLRLESLDRHWNFDQRRFTRWRSDLRTASQGYSQDAASVAQRRAEWTATRAEPEAVGLPPALQQQMGEAEAALTGAAQAVSAPLAEQANLARRGNAVESQLAVGVRDVEYVIARIDQRLLAFDAPPLWALSRSDVAGADASAQIATGFNIETRFLHEYVQAGGLNRQLLLGLELFLLPLLIWLRYRRHVGVFDPALEPSTLFLRRPVSTWLLLSAVGVIALEPDAPLLLQQSALLVALVPVLRLLPTRVRQVLGPWRYIATGLYLVERCGFAFVANPVLYRLFLLSLAGLALLLTAWVIWRTMRRDPVIPTAHPFAHALSAASWVAAILLSVSAVANVLGNVSLAEMLTMGVIDSGYMGLVLFAGVTVLLSLLRLLVSHRILAKVRMVREHAMHFVALLSRLVWIAAAIGGVVFMMQRFRVFRPVYGATRALLAHDFTFGELQVSLGSVLLFVVSVALAIWVARSVRFVLREQLLPNMELPRGVDNSIASLSYYALLLVGLLVALAASGFEVSHLAFLFGALGVGIGLGLQGMVNNFVSGLILMFERPIQPGDVVEVSGTSGTVTDIGMRATHIRTFDGADVVVPNGTLLSEKLTNWTLSDNSRRIDLEIGVAYGTDLAQAQALLLSVVSGATDIAETPTPPAVLFSGFGANSLDFSIRAWTPDAANLPRIRSELAMRVHDALRDAGIEIPFPQQDLHVRSISEAAAQMLSGRIGPGPAASVDPHLSKHD